MDIIIPTRTLRLFSFSAAFASREKGRFFSGFSFASESGTSSAMLSFEMATVVSTDFSSSASFYFMAIIEPII